MLFAAFKADVFINTEELGSIPRHSRFIKKLNELFKICYRLVRANDVTSARPAVPNAPLISAVFSEVVPGPGIT